MNMKPFPPARFFACLAIGIGMAFAFSHAAEQEKVVKLGAAGWLQFSQVGKSSDTLGGTRYKSGAFDGKNVFSPGGQLTLDAAFGDHLNIAAGFGMVSGNNLAYTHSVNNLSYALPGTGAYVAEANFSYSFLNNPGGKVSVTGGLFPYNYNPDVKNLGLYLLRGPVYPGTLISEFETKHVLPVANMMGLVLRTEWKSLTQDFLISSDLENYPYFDLSPAYIAGIQAHPSFHFGAGVSFYHLIPVDPKLTRGLKSDGVSRWFYADPTDTAGGKAPDTTRLGFAGTKLMANASFDPKPFFGNPEALGPEELKLYAEIGLIGLDNDKAHKDIYGDYLHRMPVMVGFSLPVFRTLDHLSFEVEWYGSKAQDNLNNFNQGYSDISPYPTNWRPDANGNFFSKFNSVRDNWKWSLHGSRTLQEHILLSFQVANDHYRPGVYQGYDDVHPPSRESILMTPKDWYLNAKLAYFF
jgi:hypothetical protein